MERLWSPWRYAYVTGSAGQPQGCVFCLAHEEDEDQSSLVLARGAACFVILNLFPYNNGHLMAVPNRHVARLSELGVEELAELFRLVQVAEGVLTEAYDPQGLNVGLNLGRPAGAGIADHLHVHVVPRWNGDTNFMSVVGGVRVLPEDLATTKARLQPLFARRLGGRPADPGPQAGTTV